MNNQPKIDLGLTEGSTGKDGQWAFLSKLLIVFQNQQYMVVFIKITSTNIHDIAQSNQFIFSFSLELSDERNSVD